MRLTNPNKTNQQKDLYKITNIFNIITKLVMINPIIKKCVAKE